MPNFNCGRCGYVTGRLSNIRAHLKTKKICEPIYSNVDRDTLLEALQTIDGKNASKTLNVVSNASIPYEQIENPQDFIMNLQNSHAKMKHEIVKLREENTQLKTKLNALQTTAGIGGNVTNNNTNNINININIINNFGKENMDYITPEFLNQTIQQVYDSIPTLLEHIQLDHIPNDDRAKKNCILLHRQKLDDEDKDTIKDAHNRVEIMILNSRPES
tara:strand:- start:64 stop:714 length:651 start_codon:yes stop_codon:yes gene_type:complete